MNIISKLSACLVAGLFVLVVFAAPASAQAVLAKQPITFNSFDGIYHLSRDANGRSLLTTEEVILADFPGSTGYYGIERLIPKTYQGRSVEVRVMRVTDVSGNPVPYKTSTDKAGNLDLTTGDPAISLYGPQTYHIYYQTAGVIDIKPGSNSFVLDINGRGWNQTLGQVSGVIYMPASFAASLVGQPSCYIGYLNTTALDCSVKSDNQAGQIVVTTKSDGPLAANHALVVKLNFRAATFTNKKNNSNKLVIAGVAAALVLAAYSLWRFKKAS